MSESTSNGSGGTSTRSFSGFEPLVVEEDFETMSTESEREGARKGEGAVHKNKEDVSLIKETIIGDDSEEEGVEEDEEEDDETASSTESVDDGGGTEEEDDLEQEGREDGEEEEEDDDDDNSSTCRSDSLESSELSPSNSICDVRHHPSTVKLKKGRVEEEEVIAEAKAESLISSKMSTVVDLSSSKKRQREVEEGGGGGSGGGGREMTRETSSTESNDSSSASAASKPLQKMPSVDFKNLKSGLSTLMNEPRQGEDGGVVKASSSSSVVTSALKDMPTTPISKGGSQSGIKQSVGINKPKSGMNGKEEHAEEEEEEETTSAKQQPGKRDPGVVEENKGAASNNRRKGFFAANSANNPPPATSFTIPSSGGGRPPVPPTGGTNHMILNGRDSSNLKEERGDSPLRCGSNSNNAKSILRAPNSACATGGCPAWTCCESFSAQGCKKEGRSARSVLSPLRQVTLSPPILAAHERNCGGVGGGGGGGGGGGDDASSCSKGGHSKNHSGRKKPSNVKKNYAASLPDREWNANTAPFGMDLNCQFDHMGKKISLGGNHSFRGHPGPSKNCKSKHMWARASLEREILVPQPSPSPSNRHSSYHPYPLDSNSSLLGSHHDTAAAAAAAAAAAYNHVLQNSRPNSPSPVFPSIDPHCMSSPGGRLCGSEWEAGVSCCLACSTKTFPRSTNRLSSMGCHCCRHHYDSTAGSLGGSLLGLDYEDRLLRLESDKDTLHLQVSVLSDQIEAQTSKIQDLEKLLDDKKSALESTEEHLQRELVTRSGLETQKLELMTEISGLRLKHATLERENLELKGRLGTGTGRSLTELSYPPDNRIWDKPPAVPGNRGTSPAQTLNDLGQRLRLTNDNTQGLHNQQRVQTPPANAYRRVDQSSSFGTLPRRSQPAALSTFNSAGGGVNLPVDSSSKSNSLSSGNINAISSNNYSQNGGNHKSNSLQQYLQQDKSRQHQLKLSLPPQVGVMGDNINSLLSPRKQTPQLKPYALPGTKVAYPVYESTTVGSRSTSVPNLAGTEEWNKRMNPAVTNANVPKVPSGGGHKPRKILRILGKLKRSNSGGLDNEVTPEIRGDQVVSQNPFIRGGLRATAAPRLGWAKESTPVKMPDGPIASWDSEAVVAWLNVLGLGIYANEIKRWVKSGQQLLDATTQELEKELSIKNALHRKKLSLALHYLKHPDEEDNAGKLDYHWVTRWLDDVGLPQYKEAFADARVDGRILSHMTAEDLCSLKVMSLMHHASIKRGIQVLRIHRFHPSCLCRRGSTAGLGDSITKDPKHVATWTNHRVMEWLKAVDLAEYAPNLRGSGVHGALIVFEPRFNSELLATLLSIPGNKTLLRRHLSLQFNELIGRHIVQEKRLAELAPEFIPINPTVKVKPVKKTQFPLRKKRHSNEFSEELLCATDLNVYPIEWGNDNQNADAFDSEGNFGGGGKVSNI